jgi:hypothetical protein
MKPENNTENTAGSDCQERLVRDYFTEDGAPKKCPKCDSPKITEKILAVVDVFQGMGPTCEAEYFCECGECVGFWAYGSWHPQYRESFPANASLSHGDESER